MSTTNNQRLEIDNSKDTPPKSIQKSITLFNEDIEKLDYIGGIYHEDNNTSKQIRIAIDLAIKYLEKSAIDQ